MPAAWDPGNRLSAGIEAAGLVAVLTEGRRRRAPPRGRPHPAGGHAPFGLRYLAAFGPSVPDGVISLDAMALERGVVAPVASRGLVTFAGGDPAGRSIAAPRRSRRRSPPISTRCPCPRTSGS